MRTGLSPHIVIPSFNWASVLPTMINPSNLVLWLRADQGVTRSSASISNDTLATWTLTTSGSRAADTDPAGGSGAVKYTDAVDGAPTNHGFSRVPTNVQAGPAFVDFWLKPGNLLTWARITMANSGHWIYADLTNGVAGSNSGAGDLMSLRLMETSGAWRRWRIYTQSASGNEICIVWFAKADGGASYQGDGTGTAFIGTAATYGPAYYQDRVSAWADQGGAGNNATQGTAGNQPLLKCYNNTGLWVPYGTPGSGQCEIGWPIDTTAKFMQLAAGFLTTFTGNGKPYTVVELRRYIVAPVVTAALSSSFYLNTPAAGTEPLTATTGGKLQTNHTDDGSVLKTQTSTTAYGTAWTSLAADYDGTSANIYQDGVADASNPTNLDVGQETPSAAYTHFMASLRHELIVYKSVLSATDRKRIENGMRARWGLAPI